MYIIKTSPREREAAAQKSVLEMCERDSKLYFQKSITSCYGFVLDVVAIDWLDREKKKAPSMVSYVQVASKG